MNGDNSVGQTTGDARARFSRASVVVWVVGAAIVAALWWLAWQGFSVPTACEAQARICDEPGPCLTPCQQAFADGKGLADATFIIAGAAMLGTLLLAVTGVMLRRKR